MEWKARIQRGLASERREPGFGSRLLFNWLRVAGGTGCRSEIFQAIGLLSRE